MNCITLWQPWATLIAIGAKTIETRGWPAPPDAIGKPLAIHAGKRLDEAMLVYDDDCRRALAAAGINPMTGLADGGFDWDSERDIRWLEDRDPKHLMSGTRGCVVATATLAMCGIIVGPYNADPEIARKRYVATRESGLRDRIEVPPPDIPFGDYRLSGRYGWVLADVVRLPRPIPARGMQGIWSWQEPARQAA